MDRSTSTFVAALALVFALCTCATRPAHAEQYVRKVNGKEVVVHTNPVPVVLHRVVPPYLGKHVTARQLKTGRLPGGLRK